MDYDLYNPLLPIHSHAYPKFAQVESNFMPDDAYFNSEHKTQTRDQATRVIQYLFSTDDDFDPFIPYLAMSYFDRFLSSQPLPVILEQNQRDNFNLFVICCISVAGKMILNDDFSVSVFQAERNLKFSSSKILRMEFKLLKGLQWRTRSVTAIAFVEFFSPFFLVRHPLTQNAARREIIDKIIEAQGDPRFGNFRPSVVAATAVLLTCSELDLPQFQKVQSQLCSCALFEKDDLLKCVKEMGKKYKGKEKAEGGEAGLKREAPKTHQKKGKMQLNWWSEPSTAESLGLPTLPPRIPFPFGCCSSCLPL